MNILTNPLTITLIIILAVLIAAIVALYFFGKKAQKKQAEQQQMLEANKQTVSMLIIDKKMVRLKNADFPRIVIEQTPRYLRFSKVPVVKAKIGPQILTLMCDAKVFEDIPVKKEVKAVVSGIYIMSVRGLHGSIKKEPVKKGWLARLTDKIQEKGGAKAIK